MSTVEFLIIFQRIKAVAGRGNSLKYWLSSYFKYFLSITNANTNSANSVDIHSRDTLAVNASLCTADLLQLSSEWADMVSTSVGKTLVTDTDAESVDGTFNTSYWLSVQFSGKINDFSWVSVMLSQDNW